MKGKVYICAFLKNLIRPKTFDFEFSILNILARRNPLSNLCYTTRSSLISLESFSQEKKKGGEDAQFPIELVYKSSGKIAGRLITLLLLRRCIASIPGKVATSSNITQYGNTIRRLMIIFGRLREKKILDHPLSAVYFAVSSKLLSDYTISLMIEVL